MHAGEANRRRTETPSRRVRHSARRRARRLEESNVSEFVITLVGYLFIKILRFAIYWLIVFSAFLLIAAHHRYSVRTRRVLLRRTTLLDHRHDKVPSDLANPSGFGLHACSSMIATEPNVAGRALVTRNADARARGDCGRYPRRVAMSYRIAQLTAGCIAFSAIGRLSSSGTQQPGQSPATILSYSQGFCGQLWKRNESGSVIVLMA